MLGQNFVFILTVSLLLNQLLASTPKTFWLATKTKSKDLKASKQKTRMGRARRPVGLHFVLLIKAFLLEPGNVCPRQWSWRPLPEDAEAAGKPLTQVGPPGSWGLHPTFCLKAGRSPHSSSASSTCTGIRQESATTLPRGPHHLPVSLGTSSHVI